MSGSTIYLAIQIDNQNAEIELMLAFNSNAEAEEQIRVWKVKEGEKWAYRLRWSVMEVMAP